MVKPAARSSTSDSNRYRGKAAAALQKVLVDNKGKVDPYRALFVARTYGMVANYRG